MTDLIMRLATEPVALSNLYVCKGNQRPQITELLQAWSTGDEQALAKLLPLVDHELRKIAHSYMSKERAGHTLQTTALVNEALIRFMKSDKIAWQSRGHFFSPVEVLFD
jgi:hypothetical protein